MIPQEKIKKINELSNNILTTNNMISELKNALKRDKLELNVIDGSNDGTIVQYKDKFYSKTNLIKNGLNAMLEELEKNVSIFEQQLEELIEAEYRE